MWNWNAARARASQHNRNVNNNSMPHPIGPAGNVPPGASATGQGGNLFPTTTQAGSPFGTSHPTIGAWGAGGGTPGGSVPPPASPGAPGSYAAAAAGGGGQLFPWSTTTAGAPSSPFVARGFGSPAIPSVSAAPSADSVTAEQAEDVVKTFLINQVLGGDKGSHQQLQALFPDVAANLFPNLDSSQDAATGDDIDGKGDALAVFKRRFGKGKGVWDGRLYSNESSQKVFTPPFSVATEIVCGRVVVRLDGGVGSSGWWIHNNVFADTRIGMIRFLACVAFARSETGSSVRLARALDPDELAVCLQEMAVDVANSLGLDRTPTIPTHDSSNDTDLNLPDLPDNLDDILDIMAPKAGKSGGKKRAALKAAPAKNRKKRDSK